MLYVPVYIQAADMMAYPLLSQMTKLTLKLLYSHCSNSNNISAVVILNFWLCRFNKGTLV